MITSLITLVSMSFSAPLLAHQDIAEEGAIVHDRDNKFFNIIKQHPELIVDHKTKNKFEVYGPVGTLTWLNQLGAKVEIFNDDFNDKAFASYPSPEEIEAQVKKIVSQYSDIMTLESIGQSNNGRELWVVKVSDNPKKDEIEPEVKYIANMHGDEIVGREMMVRLLANLGKRYRNGEASVVSLIDETEIYIMPSMNPDGAAAKRRANDSWRDLNRNFPDFSTRDNQNTSNGREVETKAVMKWQEDRNFALSANFHGGTKVVNYPWDTSSQKAPLTDLIVTISHEYADQVPGFFDSDEFDGGIVNGNEWYEVDGGMQDWSYYYYNDLQVTIELSHTKWPNYNTIDQYFEDNKDALVQFLGRVHQGYGIHFAADKNPDTVTVIQKLNSGDQNLGQYKVRHNEFYKVLPAGPYEFIISYQDGTTERRQITVDDTLKTLSPNYLSL